MVTIKHVNMGKPTSSPFSPGIVAGNTLYVSGQVPVDKDGNMPDGIEAQTAVVLNNLKAIIEKAGGKVENIVRCTVFMTRIAEFKQMNEAYKNFFEANGVKQFPTRSTVEVSKLAVEAALIEIDCICAL